MKSLKSRYSIAQINNNNFAEIKITNKSDTALESGLIWVPYIIQSSTSIIWEAKNQLRKSKIESIIDKL